MIANLSRSNFANISVLCFTYN